MPDMYRHVHVDIVHIFPNGRCSKRSLWIQSRCRRQYGVHTFAISRCMPCRQKLETQFVELPINVSDPKVWEGVKLRYWELDTYYLPVVQHTDDGDVNDESS